MNTEKQGKKLKKERSLKHDKERQGKRQKKKKERPKRKV